MAHEDLQSVTMAVLAADDRRRAANMANDADALEAILAPDFTYTHNTGFREGRDAYLARIRTAQVRYLSLDRLAAHVRVYVKTLYLGAWVRSGGAWRMAAYASTLAGD
jgi:hypothetical protein